MNETLDKLFKLLTAMKIETEKLQNITPDDSPALTLATLEVNLMGYVMNLWKTGGEFRESLEWLEQHIKANELREKALLVIETICVEDGREDDKNLDSIYKASHLANAECGNPHEDWLKWLEDVHSAIAATERPTKPNTLENLVAHKKEP